VTHSYELQALTDIWTGDADTAQSKQANRLVPTGLLGSIRWWFEVLVRGLGGAPCDPSSNQKACLNEQHCVVCELFGCTGWARKFRFDVRNAQDAVIISKLTKGTTFHLRFTPLRAVKADAHAHAQTSLNGALELLGGWDRGSIRSLDRATPLWQPGSHADIPIRWLIGADGLWSAVS